MAIENYIKALSGAPELAFWADNSGTIHWAAPSQVGSVYWPAEVVLMQALKRNGADLYGRTIGVNTPALSTMGSGMAAHYGAQLSHLPALVADATTVYPIAGMVQENAAAVINVNRPGSDAGAPTPPANVDVHQQGSHLHRLYLMAALELVRRLEISLHHLTGGYQTQAPFFGHNIGAVLVRRDGSVAAFGVNSANINNSFHAEVNVLQRYALSGLPWPSQSFLYTTLKPCDMCAAMIAQLLPDCTVIYIQNDPRANGAIAPLGGMTALANVHGAKQLQTFDGQLAKTGTTFDTDITQTTANLQSANPHHRLYYLTNVLDDPAIANVIGSGARGLDAKAAKYSNVTLDYYGTGLAARHPEVVRVTHHLSQIFGLAMPAPPQINPDYNRLRQDGLI